MVPIWVQQSITYFRGARDDFMVHDVNNPLNECLWHLNKVVRLKFSSYSFDLPIELRYCICQRMSNITWFISIKKLCGIHSTPWSVKNIQERLCGILSVPHKHCYGSESCYETSQPCKLLIHSYRGPQAHILSFCMHGVHWSLVLLEFISSSIKLVPWLPNNRSD